MNRTRATRVITLVMSAALVGGCAPRAPRTDEAITGEQPKLMRVLQGYSLPPSSIPPVPNADPAVDAEIRKMAVIAAQQGLTFDGSRAGEGTVVVGRMGSARPMLLALSVYPKNGSVAYQHVWTANGLDVQAANAMRIRFLNAM